MHTIVPAGTAIEVVFSVTIPGYNFVASPS